MSRSRTIITFLVNGNPNGIKTIEFSNRLIKAIVIPRALMKGSSERSEMSNAGVYFLIGSDEENNSKVYIGKAINIFERIKQHYKNEEKEFWDIAICFTTNGNKLDSADINYLENKLINKAVEAGRYKIDNGNGGNKENLSENKISDMEEYLEDLELLISNLGYPVITKLNTEQITKNIENIYLLNNRGSNAKGIYTEEGFIVLKGSTGPKDLVESQINRKGYAYRNRPKLIDQNIIKENGDNIVFLKDYLFDSPSSASAFIAGSSTNGWIVWINEKNKKTLHENVRI